MECSKPPVLSDDQISAAIDGVAEPAVLAHLEQCPACTARLAVALHLEQALRRTLQRWDCPPAQQLADYHWGLMDTDAQHRIAQHLQHCPRCTAEIAELRAFLAATPESAPAPAIATQPPAPAPPLARPRFAFRELIAQLVPQSPALALRGSAAEPILAEVDAYTILLDPQPGPAGQVTLIGQFLAADQGPWAGALVEVRQGGVLQAVLLLDDLGSFSCDLPAANPTELRFVHPSGLAVVLQKLELRQ